MTEEVSAPRSFGDPAGRLLELMADTQTPEPYKVTTEIVVDPPSKKSARAMNQAHMKVFVARTLLSAAVNQTIAPRPVRPATEDPDQLAQWEAALAEWEDAAKASQDQIKSLNDEITEAEEAWNRAFFGNQYDNVIEFFEDRPQTLWEAFEKDIKEKFLPPAGPQDGKCPACGHVTDEDAAGKDQSSST